MYGYPSINMAAPIGNTPFACDMDVINDFDSEDMDDWLFSSVRKYHALHMFELQYPTQALEWIGQEGVCVGCVQPDGSTELLELCLPDKLLANKENEGLARGRDFHFLSGGFHDKPICRIKHVNNTQHVLTSEKGCNDIRVWNRGKVKSNTSSGQLQGVAVISNTQPDDLVAEIALSEAGQAAFGSNLSSVCVTDIESGKTKYSTHDLNNHLRINGLYYMDENRLVTCAHNSGDIWVIDSRQKASQAQCYHSNRTNSASTWTFALSKAANNSCDTFVTNTGSNNQQYLCKLSNSGQLEIYDKSKLSQVLHHVNTGLNFTHSDGKEQDMNFHIQFSPSNPSITSVSGMDGQVYIYDMERWRHLPSDSKAQPSFIHQGHTACSDHPKEVHTLAHIWHPQHPNLLLSAASDGSLQAWSPVV